MYIDYTFRKSMKNYGFLASKTWLVIPTHMHNVFHSLLINALSGIDIWSCPEYSLISWKFPKTKIIFKYLIKCIHCTYKNRKTSWLPWYSSGVKRILTVQGDSHATGIIRFLSNHKVYVCRLSSMVFVQDKTHTGAT